MTTDVRPAAANRAELEEERRFLLLSLADLDSEREAGDLAEDDYRALKDDYTVRAAAVLRALDGVLPGPAFAARRARPRRINLVVATLLTVVAVGAGIAVARSAGQRVTGAEITGGGPVGSRDDAAEVERLLSAARTQLGTAPVAALKLFDQARVIDPRNVEALAYRGWILFRAGLVDESLDWLGRALAIAPDYPDARVFRGIVRFRGKNDPAAAVKDLESFLSSAPDHPLSPLVRQTLDEARAAASSAGEPTRTGK